MRGLSILLLVTLAACAGSETRSSEPPASTGAEITTSDTTETATATPVRVEAPVFAAPVSARLERLPALPVDAVTPVLAMSVTDAVLVCGYLDANLRANAEVATSCPDGTVVLGGSCTPGSVSELVHMLGESCGLRLGEYVACEAAVRESPCSLDFLHADVPECEAVNDCLAEHPAAGE